MPPTKDFQIYGHYGNILYNTISLSTAIITKQTMAI